MNRAVTVEGKILALAKGEVAVDNNWTHGGYYFSCYKFEISITHLIELADAAGLKRLKFWEDIKAIEASLTYR